MTAAALCWLILLAEMVAVVVFSHGQAKDQLLTSFDARATDAATAVHAYTEDVFERERMLAGGLPSGTPEAAAFSRQVLAAGFSSAALLDQFGRVMVMAPAGAPPPVTGSGADTAYLDKALAGRPAVSGLLTSGPATVNFALPLPDRSGRVLVAGLDLAQGPLDSLLAPTRFPGSRGFLVDAKGAPLVVEGDGAGPELDGFDVAAAMDEPLHRAGRTAVAAPVAGTPWRVLLTAPEAVVTAPADATSEVLWWLLGGTVAFTLFGGLLLFWIWLGRRRSRIAQAELEQRFRLTVENAPIGIALVTLDGRILHSNVQLQRMLGYSSEELEHLRFRDFTHPDDVEADQVLVEQLVAGQIANFHMEKRFVRRDGSVVWAKLSVSLVRDSAGRPLHFVSQVEDVTAVRAVQAELQRRALYDPLTGLANRNLLLDRLAQLLSRRDGGRGTVAVAFCDLDHFKRINDSLGHDAGDQLLREVSARMLRTVRSGDTVARMGGDEFVLLLTNVESEADATATLDRVKAAVEAPIHIDGQELVVSFSAGLAVGDADQTAETLLRDADTALYAAKDQGRSRWELYTAAMRHHALMQLSVESELRRAIETDAFELHYQPIVDLRTGGGVAYEALLRWRHHERGVVVLPPGFLEVAEESQLIVPLGQLVLRQACQFLARHPEASWRVFVNVSPVQIGRGLVGVVTSELADAGVPAARLGLEITESGVLDATGPSLREMQQLADMGVFLLMDDFGTGYSALTSVLEAPISGLKLDRSFTARLGDGGTGDRISATVANLITSLGTYGVVEGIENEDQRQRALSHGWSLGQGYLLGRPAPESSLIILDDDAGMWGGPTQPPATAARSTVTA